MPQPLASPVRRRALTAALLPTFLLFFLALPAAFVQLRGASASAATTFVVNSTGDLADLNTSDGICKDGTGACTLRAAIQQANASPGADTINFQIPGTAPHTIAPATALPVVTDSLTIDATTQPGFAGRPIIVLTGRGTLAANGLTFQSGTGVVRGLVVNGFRTAGIRLGNAAGGIIAGNYIGTDAAGSAAFGNGTGVVIDSNSVLVGGTDASARNVISGNGTGVVILGSNSTLYGNYIGVAADGMTPVPNTGDGIHITSLVNPFGIAISRSQNSIVGGTGAGQANLIAFNGGNGIFISAHERDGLYNNGHAFRGNRIYSNTLRGIRLAPSFTDNVVTNDAGDADDGPNGLQNYPVLRSVTGDEGTTTIAGTLDSKPSTDFTIDFYANSACDPSGLGQGQIYVGSTTVKTDATGSASFTATFPLLLSPSLAFTATATDPAGNTSEFSACHVGSAQSTVQFADTLTPANEHGGAAKVIVTRTLSGTSDGAASVAYATSDGTARAGKDYVPASGIVSFAPGETTKVITIQLINDSTDEFDETINLTLSDPTGDLVLGGHPTATVSIVDDDLEPLVTFIRSTVVTEGDTGTTEAAFTVFLEASSEKPVTVSYWVGPAILPNSANPYEDFQPVDNGTLVFNPGETAKTITVLVNGDTEPELQELFSITVTQQNPRPDRLPWIISNYGYIFDDDDAPGISFSAAHYNVNETDGSATITVVRRGNTSTHKTVNYSMPTVETAFDLTNASPRGDYTPAFGTLNFAPGETEKSFTVLINDDDYVEDIETVILRLNLPSDFSTAGFWAELKINSDDTDQPAPANNPLNEAQFFVRQHYHDFLGREPDAAGLQFWMNQLAECEERPEAERQSCREIRRINVSAAFFLSTEFQETGYLIYKTFGAAFGTRRAFGGVPLTYDEFLPDAQRVSQGVVVNSTGWEARLEANKTAFFLAFVKRQQFLSAFPDSLMAEQFVNRLEQNMGLLLGAAEKAELVASLSAAPTDPARRAQVLRAVAENPAFDAAEKRRAFVLMQYFGYLRRHPDQAGFNFWLQKLNQFGGDYVAAEMVKAFIEAGEYRQRFGL